MILHLNKGHKDHMVVQNSLDILSKMLAAYPYNNDRNMARFVIDHWADIETILPGYGSTCYRKRLIESIELLREARKIYVTPKHIEYEIAF